MYCSVSFDKCTQATLTSQIKVQSISVTVGCSLVPLYSQSPPPSRGNHCWYFCHRILVILLLELHTSEVIQCVFFYALLFSLNTVLLRSSMLSCIAAVHSFFKNRCKTTFTLQHIFWRSEIEEELMVPTQGVSRVSLMNVSLEDLLPSSLTWLLAWGFCSLLCGTLFWAAHSTIAPRSSDRPTGSHRLL